MVIELSIEKFVHSRNVFRYFLEHRIYDLIRQEALLDKLESWTTQEIIKEGGLILTHSDSLMINKDGLDAALLWDRSVKKLNERREAKLVTPRGLEDLNLFCSADQQLYFKASLLFQIEEELTKRSINPELTVYAVERYTPGVEFTGMPHVPIYANKVQKYIDILEDNSLILNQNEANVRIVCKNAKDFEYARDTVGFALAHATISTKEKYFGLVVGVDKTDLLYSSTLLRPHMDYYKHEGHHPAIFIYNGINFNKMRNKYGRGDVMHYFRIGDSTATEATFTHNIPHKLEEDLIAIVHVLDPVSKELLGLRKPTTIRETKTERHVLQL